jgi:hypothetical protein
MPQALKELHGGEELRFCFVQLIAKVAARRLPQPHTQMSSNHIKPGLVRWNPTGRATVVMLDKP